MNEEQLIYAGFIKKEFYDAMDKEPLDYYYYYLIGDFCKFYSCPAKDAEYNEEWLIFLDINGEEFIFFDFMELYNCIKLLEKNHN